MPYSAFRRFGPRPRLNAEYGICNVHVYYHERGFTKARAEDFATRISQPAIRVVIHEHDIPTPPNALFIGALIRAEEARTILSPIPHQVSYLFRPDYPESEGGDLTGRTIGVGYIAEYNDSRRGDRSRPGSVTSKHMRDLLNPTCTNAEFQRLLYSLTLPGLTR